MSRKYFLDIDKVPAISTYVCYQIQRFAGDVEEADRRRVHGVCIQFSRIVSRYMECIEEIINIDVLL